VAKRELRTYHLTCLVLLVSVVAIRSQMSGQIQSGAAYTIVNQLSGNALDDTGASMANGTQMQQWACNGQPQQNWVLTGVGGGYYRIINQLSGKALDDTNASTANGTIMQQWTPNGQQQQNWMLNGVGDGHYTVVNQLSGKALDDTGASYANGTKVQQWTPNGQKQQNWSFFPAAECGFQILIDTNQMNLTEAQNAGQFAADGVWAVVVNSGPGQGVNPPITNPAGTWPAALSSLNAQSWIVAEDIVDVTPNVCSYSSPYNWSVDTVNSNLTLSYLGFGLNAVDVYLEPPICNPPSSNDTNVCTSSNSNNANVFPLPCPTIEQSASQIPAKIIVHSRSFADTRQAFVQAATADPTVSGIVFEFAPHAPGSPNYAASTSNINLNQGVVTVLQSAKKVYLLMAPSGDWNQGISSSYASDVSAFVSQYLSLSGQLHNPNLYIVLAAYGRGTNPPGTPNGVGFLTPDDGISGNSILAALSSLKSYRGF